MGKTGPHNGSEGLRASLRAPPPQFDAALERALAESADAYAHHQAPPTANDEDDELQRALKASADGRAAPPSRTSSGAARPRRRRRRRSTPGPQYPALVPARRRRRSTTRPTCLLASRAGPSRTSRARPIIMDTRTSTTIWQGPSRRRARPRRSTRGAAATSRPPRVARGARLAAAPPPAAPPAPAGPAARVRCEPAPPGLPPGLAGFPVAPKLPRDPLAAFLDGAGMGRYLGLFRDEEIRTLEDFRLLTARDLHDIGLPPHDAAVLHQRTAARCPRTGSSALLVGSRTLPTSDRPMRALGLEAMVLLYYLSS